MISLVFAAALLAAAAEPAQSAAGAPQAKSEKPDKDGMVCKKEAVVGSRMKQRVCMTQAQWDQRKTDVRDEIEKAQSNKPLNF
jgi:hypothetical protein